MTKNADIAIVVIAYNRVKAIQRLMNSLLNAHYPDNEITLYVSVDHSDKEGQIKALIESCNWSVGKLNVITYEENLGLKKHIFKCMDLVDSHDSIVLLEDDLFVSPYFYEYAQKSYQFYKDDSDVAGISLYSYDYNEFVRLPFVPIQDGYDNYFLKLPSSLGQMFTKKQILLFKKQLNNNLLDLDHTEMIPEQVYKWENSWKRYFFKYLHATDTYFVYPRVSLTSNFSDHGGSNISGGTNRYQVNLLYKSFKYNFSKQSHSKAVYDSFFDPQSSMFIDEFKKMNVNKDQVEIDLYGNKNLSKSHKKYALSIKAVAKEQYLRSFSNKMFPLANNIIYGIHGDYVYLAKINCFLNKVEKYKELELTDYSKLKIYPVEEKALIRFEKVFKKKPEYILGRILLYPFREFYNLFR